MGILATDNRQLIYIYSEASQLGKKVLAYINAIDRPKRIININEESISKTIWLEIAAMLGCDLYELFDTSNATSVVVKDASALSIGDWLKIVDHNPELLQQPILIKGTDAKVITQVVDAYSYFEATGGDFDKSTEVIKNGNHKNSSEGRMTNRK